MTTTSLNQADLIGVDDALKAFQYATKVRLSVLSGLSPSMMSHPHEHYGSHKDFYHPDWSSRNVGQRLARYAANGFIPWGFEKPGDVAARFEHYVLLVRHAMDWAFNHVLNSMKVNHRELAAHMALAMILTEEGLYSWALNL